MTSATPAWQPFDPSSDRTPDSLRQVLEADGGVVLIVGDPAGDGSYSTRAALRIAEMFAAHRERVLLLDLDVERSSLGRELGEIGGEGLSDVLLFGASLPRVVRAVRDGTFLFSPTGTVVGDPGRVLDHPGLGALLAAYTGPGSTVLAYMDRLRPESIHLLTRADGVVMLGGPGLDLGALNVGDRVGVSWLGPEVAPEVALEANDRIEGAPPDTGPDEGRSESVPHADANPDPGPDPLLSDPLSVAEEEAESEEADSFASLELTLAEELAAEAVGDPEDSMPQDELDPFWDEVGASLSSDADSEPAADAAAEATTESPDDPLFADAAAPVPAPDVEVRDEPVAAVASGSSGSKIWLLAVLVFVAAALIVWGVLWRGSLDHALDAEAEASAPVQVTAERTAEPQPRDAGEDAPVPSEPLPPAADGPVPADPTSEDPQFTGSTTDPEVGSATPSVPAAALDWPAQGERFGLTINSHERLEAAEEQAAELAARFPGLHFVLAPVAVNGIGYVRVIAGPAPSAGAAEAVRETLSGFLGPSVARGAIVRSARLAYSLGSFATVDEARARVARAREAGIPGYVAEGSEGGPFFVYAGAYGNETEATYLRVLLSDAGLDSASLTERTGRPLR